MGNNTVNVPVINLIDKILTFEPEQYAEAAASEDLFTQTLLGFKENGFYLEIGSGDPDFYSTTQLFEKTYDWAGVSIEIDKDMHDRFTSERKNVCLNVDAFTVDYSSMLKEHNAPTQIDFLMIDAMKPLKAWVGPPHADLKSFEMLSMLPLDEYRFSVIVFKHDSYINDVQGSDAKKKARSLLESKGYKLLLEDVSALPDQYFPFEDYFIDASVITEENILCLPTEQLKQ